MAEKKKMYVVFCEDNEKYWCSYNTWSDQLRKATIFHSTKYANEVHKRYKELRLKNVEVPMGVVPGKPTNADRIRQMSDEELALWICGVYDIEEENGKFINGIIIPGYSPHDIEEWLQQPAEEG